MNRSIAIGQDPRTGNTVLTMHDGSFIRLGTVLDDGMHIAVGSGPRGPAEAFEAATAVQACEMAARQISTWRAEGKW